MMVSLLEDRDDKLSDIKLWGVSKPAYTFSDLLKWLANGGDSLTKTKTEIESDMEEKKNTECKLQYSHWKYAVNTVNICRLYLLYFH